MSAAFLALFAAELAAGFNLVRDPDNQVPIAWQTPAAMIMIQQSGSDDISDGSAIIAVRNALATWNAVPCSAFRFADAGLTASRSIAQDGTNVITWLESDWPGAAAGAGAYTTRYLDSSTPKHWIEADISINGVDYTWGTDGDVHKIDAQGVVLHELGHVLGFSHSVNPQAVMYFRAQGGTTYARTLHDEEIKGACFLYPAGSFSCANDDECPLYWAPYGGSNLETHCAQGACAPGASGSYAAACFVDGDCASGHCALDPAMPPSTEPGFCTLECTPGAPSACPNGDYCRMESPMNRCYVGRDDCTIDSDCTGGRNWVCDRDLDGRNRCRHLCRDDSNCAGVPSSVCHGGTGMNPPGFCRVPGPKAEGERCRSGLECASLTCTGGGPLPTCAAGVPGFTGDGGPSSDAAGSDAGPRADAGGGASGLSDAGDGARDGAAGGMDSESGTSAISGSAKCGCSSAGGRSGERSIAPLLAALALMVLSRSRAPRLPASGGRGRRSQRPNPGRGRAPSSALRSKRANTGPPFYARREEGFPRSDP
jgi:matrixin